MPHLLSLHEILAARARIRDGVEYTPAPFSPALSELTGCRIFCKLDHMQRTGSFKERGARNALLCLDPAQQKAGVIAASAGNHALGLAWHGRLLGIHVTVVMPRFAPLIKVETCRRMGAHVVLEGHSFAEARQAADRMAAESGAVYINGYDDPAILAGQGTLALELLEQIPGLDAVIVPIGGGGLLAGVATAIKALRPSVRIIGVEASHVASWHSAVAAKHPVATAMHPTLADGLAVPCVGVNAFASAAGKVDRLCLVEESDIALAILRIVELEKSVVEGAAATTLAALLAHPELTEELQGLNTALLFCGGNIDPTILSRILQKGLAADGRICRISSLISDRPGGLARFTAIMASTGAGILDVFHDRTFSGPDVSAVRIVCTAETRDRAHINELLAALIADGFHPSLIPHTDHS